MKTRVRIASRMTDDRIDEQKLAQAGWDVVKTATPDPKDRSEKPLADDGKRASDEPADVKVVADQHEPVTSTKQADRVIRREEIIENDGATAVAERGPEEEEREEADAERDHNFYNSSKNVLAAFKLAELEQELGLDGTLWDGADKFARVASLEAESVDALRERINTLKNVKQAGLTRTAKKKTSLPPMGVKQASTVTASDDSGYNDSLIFS
jgi:hypothetical protein